MDGTGRGGLRAGFAPRLRVSLGSLSCCGSKLIDLSHLVSDRFGRIFPALPGPSLQPCLGSGSGRDLLAFPQTRDTDSAPKPPPLSSASCLHRHPSHFPRTISLTGVAEWLRDRASAEARQTHHSWPPACCSLGYQTFPEKALNPRHSTFNLLAALTLFVTAWVMRVRLRHLAEPLGFLTGPPLFLQHGEMSCLSPSVPCTPSVFWGTGDPWDNTAQHSQLSQTLGSPYKTPWHQDLQLRDV